jgi:hypothetical protein
MTVHVLRVTFTSTWTAQLTGQNPESLTCGNTVAPGPGDQRQVDSGQSVRRFHDGAMGPATVVSATVAEP